MEGDPSEHLGSLRTGFSVSWKAGKQNFVIVWDRASVIILDGVFGELESWETEFRYCMGWRLSCTKHRKQAFWPEHVGVLLDELTGSRVTRLLRVDNSSAISMLPRGQGSWRTRHLKVRCAFVREQVEQGLLVIEDVDGLLQLADLATKLHPSQIAGALGPMGIHWCSPAI